MSESNNGMRSVVTARSPTSIRIIACLLTVILPAWTDGVRADQYQEQITRAFPGFEILKRSDFSEEIRKTVRPNPALITGRFNRDELDDFAAIIIDRSKAHGQPLEKKYYLGRFVVCHGTGKGRYECQVLKEERMHLPYNASLFRARPGKVLCIANQKDLSTKEVIIEEDAFGWGVPDRASRVYIYRADGTYWECREPPH